MTLAGTFRLQDLLNHLYVLVPVLDAEKHYWIGQDEVEKLLRKGEGWLGSHPHKLWISPTKRIKRKEPMVGGTDGKRRRGHGGKTVRVCDEGTERTGSTCR